jgi:hypothetical protein
MQRNQSYNAICLKMRGLAISSSGSSESGIRSVESTQKRKVTHYRLQPRQESVAIHRLICFDLSTFGTKFRHTPLRFSIQNNLLLSLLGCGREARECGQPVGRASDGLDLTGEAFGAVHGLSTRLARAGPQGCGLVHISTGWRCCKHIGSGHTRQIATVDHAEMRGLVTDLTSLRRGAGLSL